MGKENSQSAGMDTVLCQRARFSSIKSSKTNTPSIWLHEPTVHLLLFSLFHLPDSSYSNFSQNPLHIHLIFISITSRRTAFTQVQVISKRLSSLFWVMRLVMLFEVLQILDALTRIGRTGTRIEGVQKRTREIPWTWTMWWLPTWASSLSIRFWGTGKLPKKISHLLQKRE